jgi:hypothetical protein
MSQPVGQNVKTCVDLFRTEKQIAGEKTMKRHLVVTAVLSLTLFFSAARVRAQENGTPVHMVVSVEARHASNTPNIGRDDVMVYEGHERDQVMDWVPAQGDHAGLDLFILLDDSSNISLGSQLEDIRQFILAQPASTQVGVAYMQNGIAKVVQNLTTDHAQAGKALRLPLGIRGINASPYFSLSDLAKKWPISSNRREIVMVSDGIDLYYGSNDLLDPYLSQAIDDLQKAGILVYAIYSPGVGHFGHSYWTSYWGQLYLARVAEETGGESYYIGMFGAPVSFVPYLDDVSHHLGNQYLLSFLPKPEKKAGFRSIRLMTEVPNAELVSADRVFVPANQ